MLFKRSSALLFVAGEGGHTEQMLRVLNKLEEPAELGRRYCIFLTSRRCNIDGYPLDQLVVVPELREKHKETGKLSMVLRAAKIFFVSLSLFLRYDIRIVISTGPGIAVPTSVLGRMFFAPVIFIETWSKFESPSFAGRIMKRLATRFYYQNRELASFYPNGTFSGRL